MYADRVEAVAKRSIKERLNGNSADGSSLRRRQLAGKRQRQDDKWEHDLYEDDGLRVSSMDRKIAPTDLRLKLNKKNFKASQGVKGSSIPVMKDLRERLSGTMTSQPMNVNPPRLKSDAAKPIRRSVAAGAPEPEVKNTANAPARKKQKAETSVDAFLSSLDLGKYLRKFQAEEVDMAALVHMTDVDLKAIGIPMGPRKKILLALESRGGNSG